MIAEDGHQPSPAALAEDAAAVDDLVQAFARLRGEIARVVVGQERVVEELMIALLCQGHCILEGVPGLAKTLLVSTLARTLSMSFSRVQFTPDLMPSDITGTEVIEDDRATGTRQLRFVRGPVFANVILADEINRTPPKTQAALLEAMQERQVTAAGFTHKLPLPFFVLATQNPIEQEGTYPLPEAQLDRFMFKIHVGYPTEDEELRIIRLTTSVEDAVLTRVMDAAQVQRLQEVVRRVPCADHVMRYAMRVCRATRATLDSAPEFVRDYLAWGAGPRATQHLVMASKARAILAGRFYAGTDDIRAVARPVLRHRLITNFNAEADGVTADELIQRLMDETPDDDDGIDPQLARRVFSARPSRNHRSDAGG